MKKTITFLFGGLFLINVLNAQLIFSEGFEAGNIPSGWTQYQIGTSAIWFNNSSTFSGGQAQEGNKCVGYWGDAGFSTVLTTPEVDLSAPGNDTLSFYYTLKAGATLDVAYKTSNNYNLLGLNLSPTNTWKKVNVYLPNSTSSYQVGFYGTSSGVYDMNIDDIKITNHITTTTNETPNKKNINIHPNPTRDIIHLTNLVNYKSYSLYNILGEQIQEGNITTNTTTLNLADLSEGIYIIALQSKNGEVHSSKIFKLE